MDEHPVAQWRIEQIGTLDEFSFRAAVPPLAGDAFTLTLWYQPALSGRRQVIARLNPPDLPGWCLLIEDGSLHAEYGMAEQAVARVSGAQVAIGEWAFAALIQDDASGELRLFSAGESAAAALEAPGSPPSSIIIGGYTDPAGGHFDHTFGRGGSGWADDVRLFNRVLSDAELIELARRGDSVPVAQFTHSPLRAAPCEIDFEAALQADACTCLWDFGDGQTGLGQTIRHAYPYAGTYTARLTVVSDGHQQSHSAQSLTLSGAENPISPVPVFVNGTEGHACYRIPSIIRAANGDLLAFAEGRRESCSDSTPVIRIVCKRSSDNGQSWQALQIAAQHTHAGGEYALMNPSPVVDSVRGSGRIVLLYNAQTTNEWALVRGEGRSLTFCITSDDHGHIWSAPQDISAMIRGGDDWRIQRPTLGHALQTQSGRLVHASTFMAGDKSVFHSQNVLVWSDDLGATWRCGAPCPTIGLNEATAVELADGTILINSRSYIDGKPAGRRGITRAAFSVEGDVEYTPTSFDPALIDSAVQASLLRLSDGRLVFSNPAHPHARGGLTLRVSSDDGASWPYSRMIDAGAAAYSDLVVQADGRVGVLYERGNHGGIAYVSVPADWL